MARITLLEWAFSVFQLLSRIILLQFLIQLIMTVMGFNPQTVMTAIRLFIPEQMKFQMMGWIRIAMASILLRVP